MKQIRSLTFTVVFLQISLVSVGQKNIVCGTLVPREYLKKQLSQKESDYPVIDPFVRKTLSVIVHIVKDSLGNPNFTVGQVNAMINVLNTNFSPIKLSFQVCEIKYIDNYQYDGWTFEASDPKQQILTYKDSVINIYLAAAVFVGNVPVGGYAYFPGGPDMIVLAKSGAIGVITHEMGHFLGLFHTFDIGGGVELVNRSNCTVAGDLICDTEADPNGGVDAGCELYPEAKDPNGDWYVPPTDNFMSYYDLTCVCKFTTGQYNRMVNQFFTGRNYLW